MHQLKITTIINCIILLLTNAANAQNTAEYGNNIYKDNIKSVQLFLGDDALSMPIMQLTCNDYITLKFDEIGNKLSNYQYTVLHCDANWKPSTLMQNEYIDGFFDNPMDDYALSFNTNVNYTNYLLTLPNENMSFKYSGNYILIVYEGKDRENVVLTRRFYITEPKTSIKGRIKPATFDAYQGSKQEVDFEVDFSGTRLLDPSQEVKVVVMKNRRWDNAIRNLKPRIFENNLLDYNYDKENVFNGGNEYRFFDIRSWRYQGEGITKMQMLNGFMHITVNPSEIRSNKEYFYYREMNGNYRIENPETQIEDPDTECDYAMVHFTLNMPKPLVGGKVNVFGRFSNRGIGESYAMKWNFEEKRYELSLLLKQGYYNYEYVYIPDNETAADESVIEGAFYDTENDYQIFVYYRTLNSGRYDQLVGVKQLNSLENQVYKQQAP